MSNQEQEFGYRVRQALNEGLERLDYPTLHKLEQARLKALARQKAAQTETAWVPQPAGAGGSVDPDDAAARWWHRLGVLLPLAVLAAAFFAVAEWHHARSIRNQANLDFAVLMDETPIDAVSDKGFGVFLQTGDVPAPKE
ncbi:MAG: DUF3619 family protein [Burkholderiales bacterium]|jgi:hypothetical protein|nr:DUF3619 family protein [Burkholderiales bacterium]